MNITQIKTKVRRYFVKQGLIKPRNLKETQEVFSFPYAANDNPQPKRMPIALSLHIEKMNSGYHNSQMTR